MPSNLLNRLAQSLRVMVVAYAGSDDPYLVSGLTKTVEGFRQEIAGIEEILGFYERAGEGAGLPEFAADRAEHRANMEALLAERRENLKAFSYALNLVKGDDK